MLVRWSRFASNLSKTGLQRGRNSDLFCGNDVFLVTRYNWFSKVSAAKVSPSALGDSREFGNPDKSLVKLDKMFWSKPSSLALGADSPLRVEKREHTGLKRVFFTLMLYYSQQSRFIRGANVVYKRIISQVDKPAIYEGRLKQEGKEGSEFGQYLYEIYNHDVEVRVSKAGVNLLLSKWMKELEKIFYGNVVAYDTALLPGAKEDELQNVIWRNIFSDDGKSEPDPIARKAVQAMARYVRRETACLSITDKEVMFSGNFIFTPMTISHTTSV